MSRIDLDAELTKLEWMSRSELRLAWGRWVKTSPPNVSAGLLRLALAHHLQSKVLGGVPKATEKRLRDAVRGRSVTAPQAGARLIREWRGKVHVVSVTDEGRYRWGEQDWNSLSEIARTITGTRWSGPAFFGTKPKRRQAA
ncbi:MAG: hypothetical protein AVDCRST_MAG09-308 [uncultured Sphingomonas sp.]|uniref:Bacteriophage-related protein n=1 Tax=uncultured Sphingomonas sp. TaxID=158754 RepID=A0A6J4SE28_9SPHN|nr:DUF2924 domain-containing protein [uncultured Sphingomonas sp.]CAA9495860.1 MAG: hypothetical protein AVDCRST_MAG09-308 [uncultured Sphingomonas sp.]